MTSTDKMAEVLGKTVDSQCGSCIVTGTRNEVNIPQTDVESDASSFNATIEEIIRSC